VSESSTSSAAGQGRVRVGDYLSAEEIRGLASPAPWRIAVDTGLIWLVVLAAFTVFHAFPQPWVFALCFVINASRQLAMTHLVHDASHYRLSKSRRLNDLLSDAFAAGPVLISTESYRLQHLPHHQYLGDVERDTDRRTWYSIKGWHFVRRTLLTLVGWEAVVTFFSYAKVEELRPDERAETASDLPRRLLFTALGNGLLVAWCAFLGNVWLYLWLWFLPLFTLTMYLLILRVLAEHQKVEFAARGIDCPHENIQQPLTRTLLAGPMAKFLLGPLNFHYHHEHHLAPSVPYHRLPQFHRLLLSRGYYRDHPEALGTGYFSTLFSLVFPARAIQKTEAVDA
jgi:fatty acid desaturase